jgi:predicted alpha/beta-fold hydrolase
LLGIADIVQIAVYEAIPFQEFKQNPYTVLLTTSLGGHLSWFEIGGGRWHAKPV